MIINKKHTLILFLLVLFALISFSLYKFIEYKEYENDIKLIIKQKKIESDSLNIILLKNNIKELKSEISKKNSYIDSLEIEIKYPTNKFNFENEERGFIMNGQSISLDEMLKNVNKTYDELSFYKTAYKMLKKEYNFEAIENDNSVTIKYDNSNIIQNINLQNKYDLLNTKYNSLFENYKQAILEKNKYLIEKENYKTALELIEKNYNIKYEITPKNDSVNVISVDKLKKRNKKE